MSARLITIAIVLFWMLSVGWLCAVIWAPPESRMAQVDPRIAINAFFNWGDSTRMTLLENGERRGELSISSGAGQEGIVDSFNTVSLTGSLDADRLVGGEIQSRLSWNGFATFHQDLKFEAGGASLRLPKLGLTSRFDFEGDPLGVKVELAKGKLTLFRFDSKKDQLGEGGMLGESVVSSLIEQHQLGALLNSGALDPTKNKIQVDARLGGFSFGGREIRAYLLTFGNEEVENAVRVFLSEAGEPLRVETGIGYEAVSEFLVPIESYILKKEEG